MRLALKIIFVLLITAAKAQQSKKTMCTDITKAELEKKEKLSDFGVTPPGCTVASGEITRNVNGKIIAATAEGDNLGTEFIKTLASSSPGTKIYFDIVYLCGSQTRHETYCYKIITK